jgi:hypothetical protein
MTDLIWSFSPWLVFLLASRLLSLTAAACLAFAAALAVLARAATRRHAHMLDVAGPCYFAVLGLALTIAHPAHTEIWSRYAQLGSHLVLTALIFGSILAGHPFTEAYAPRTLAHPAVPERQPPDLGHLGPRLHHRRHLPGPGRLSQQPAGAAAGHSAVRNAVPRLPVHPEPAGKDPCTASSASKP